MQVLVLTDMISGADALNRFVPIVHTASPRLFVVRVEPTSLSDLAGLVGVVAVTEGELPVDVASGLDESETLFATAFAARHTSKERIGDGLPWDAPGFEPPDARQRPNSAQESAESRPGQREGRSGDG